MGEDRGKKQNRLALIGSIRGHENTVAHAFNHTDGHCPKCGCKEHHLLYCKPGSGMGVRLCELEGEHLHRICGACKYPWVERCLDQAMLAEERGEYPAESELAAVLVAIALKMGGVVLSQEFVASYRGWLLRFERDAEREQITVTAAAPAEEMGTIAHPKGPDDILGGGG